MLNTPVLFLIFNRADVTQKVFDRIKKAQPRQLFVAADGPRENVAGEDDICRQVRRVIEGVDWDCQVKKLYRDKNLGCKKAVSSAITWFFENVEEGIILEDDCLPDPGFFGFCQELLPYYRNQEKVMMIGGANFQAGKNLGPYSYYFSKYCHIWGWATWKRAWQSYDREMKTWPVFKGNEGIKRICKKPEEQRYWTETFDKVFNNEINTWDYQWLYASWRNEGVSIIPRVNMVSNIGFGREATHTSGDCSFANMPSRDVGAIVHPPEVRISEPADEYTFINHYAGGYNGNWVKLKMLNFIKRAKDLIKA